jgi:O-antigen/teichoic acid export membrane protein
MLGVYSIALMFASLPTQLMQQIHASVVFPAFSRKLGLRPSGGEFGSWYRRIRLVMLVYSGLGIACLAASGPWLIATLYDPRYADAGWIMQLLAFGTWAYALAGTCGSALLALGQPRWLALANGAKVVGIVFLIPLGFQIAEFPGAIAGFAGAELLRYAALAIGAHRAGLGMLRRDLLISVLVAAAVLAGLSAAEAVAARGFASWVSLAAALATSAALWTGFSYALVRREGLSPLALIRSATI